MTIQDFDRRLGSALDDLVPEPPGNQSLFADIAIGVRHRQIRTAVAAGVAVLLVLIAVPFGLKLARHAASGADTPASAPSSDAARQAAAERDAAYLWSKFSIPPGARQVGIAGPLVVRPGAATQYRYAQSGTWTVAEPLGILVDRLRTNVPAGMSVDSYSLPNPPTGFDIVYAAPDVPGFLIRRILDVSVTVGESVLDLNISSSSTWLPVRPPAIRLPGRTASVTVTLHSMAATLSTPADPMQTFGPATITNAHRVTTAVKLINSLPMAAPQDDPTACTANSRGGGMTAVFRDAAGHVVERLQMDIDGCAINTIFAPDGTVANLSSVDGMPDASLATKLRSLLGLDWVWTS